MFLGDSFQKLIVVVVQVHYKFELMEETLYLTINLIDRFLAVTQHVPRKKLQLVGVTALLLACKYEEVSVPVVDDLIVISDKAYTRREVLDMVNRSQPCMLSRSLCNGFVLLAGEVNGEYIAVQLLSANSLCVHEEVSQSCTI